MWKLRRQLYCGAMALSALALQFTEPTAAQAACDVEQGKRLFTKCSACHSLTPNQQMMGPSLHNIMDKKAGTEKGYRYSQAMQHSNIRWNDNNLHKFLESPMQFLPGTSMPFGGIRNAKDRDALLCFISSSTTSLKEANQ